MCIQLEQKEETDCKNARSGKPQDQVIPHLKCVNVPSFNDGREKLQKRKCKLDLNVSISDCNIHS